MTAYRFIMDIAPLLGAAVTLLNVVGGAANVAVLVARLLREVRDEARGE